MKNFTDRIVNCTEDAPLSKHGQFLASQGVLMLHSGLTVANDNPRSHLHAWRHFTQAILRLIVHTNPDVLIVPIGVVARDMVATSLLGVNYKKLWNARSRRRVHELVTGTYIERDEDWILHDNVGAGITAAGRRMFRPSQIFYAGHPSKRNSDLEKRGALHRFIGSDVYRKVNRYLA